MSAATTETNLLPQTNGINCNNNQKVSATNSDQINSVETNFVINGTNTTSNSDSGKSSNGITNDKNNQTALKNSTNRMRQPPLVDDINNPNRIETILTTSINGGVTAAATLSRTLTRNSCSNMNGQSIAKSWYARCNRWRSQSCDRRKHTATRYSWNMVNHRPA